MCIPTFVSFRREITEPMPWTSRIHRFTLLVVALLIPTFGGVALADDGDQKPLPPVAKFLTLPGSINSNTFGKVQKLASQLQHQAGQEDRTAVLVLQLTPGSSRFHDVQGLAKYLTSAKIANVKTIAWVPETVTGNNAVIALVCREIVMHPDAELGDVGRGQALEDDDQQAVLSLIRKRTNVKVSEALVRGMMDPGQVVKRITLKTDAGTETRTVTQSDLEGLRDAKVIIEDVKPIKEGGQRGFLSGRAARAMDVLVTQTAETRNEVANLYGLPRKALREDVTTGDAPVAKLIEIHEMIEPILEEFVIRQIDREVAKGANLLIFHIDSPGGLVSSSDHIADYIAKLESKKVRTVAYIPDWALSGATMIALGCDEIYLLPDARFGDVEPIGIGKGGQFEHVPEKQLSDVRTILKTLAERKGRPGALVEAMADKDLLVYKVTNAQDGRIWYMTEEEIANANEQWIKGPVVPETRENNLLTVNGNRAHELRLAEEPVEDFDDLKLRLGIPADEKLVAVGRTWVDSLVFVLNIPLVTGLLFVLGAICIVIEVHTWTSFFGILSAVFFALFFWSRFLGGTAGWLEVVLFVLGIVCVAMEIFVIPGFGIFGVSGGLLMLTSIVLACETFVVPKTSGDFSSIGGTLGTLSGSAVVVIVLAMMLSHYLPKMPILRGLVLAPPGERGEEELVLPPEHGAIADEPLVGQQGLAKSDLRPAGKAQFDDAWSDVVSDGPYIENGSTVEIVGVTGNRIVVRHVS